MAGVVLYAKYHGTSLKRYLYVGLYGTSLSPIMTQMMHIGKFPAPVCLMLSLLLGLAIGFVLPPLCTHVHYAHQGYSLYNVGFGAGIIATVVVSLAKSFGIKVIPPDLVWLEIIPVCCFTYVFIWLYDRISSGSAGKDDPGVL